VSEGAGFALIVAFVWLLALVQAAVYLSTGWQLKL
jgi:hypothetical protein